MQELQVTMLGARGVGKTTLLTAIYEQFEKNIGSTNLELTPNEESAAKLQDCLIKLKSTLDHKSTVDVKQKLKGDNSIRSFLFGLGKKGKKPSLQIRFQDYPGGYHESSTSSEDKNRVKELLGNSVAVLIAIDAPALMEEKGKLHEQINRPQQITSFFKSAYQELNSPRLVIFAPVKCEKYLKDENSAQELLNKVKEGYSGLINYFDSEEVTPWMVSVVTPVQTLGNVVFSRIEYRDEGDQKYPCFYFRKVRPDAQYDPKDSEQPLRYLLRFILRLHLEQRKIPLFNFLRDLFNADKHLKIAIEQFARECKSSGQFTILKGEQWLNLK